MFNLNVLIIGEKNTRYLFKAQQCILQHCFTRLIFLLLKLQFPVYVVFVVLSLFFSCQYLIFCLLIVIRSSYLYDIFCYFLCLKVNSFESYE